MLLLVLVAGLKAAGPAGAAGLDLVVNDTRDLVDAKVGDGACRTSAATCTLRAAIQETNARAGADVVHLPGGTYALAIAPRNQNDITTGDLDITDSLEIRGAGPASTVVDGGTPPSGSPPEVRGLDRLFEVLVDGGAVSFSGLTVSDGYAAEYGGGIMNSSTATVSVTAAALRTNVAGKTGGAIDNHVGGSVAVSDSTLSGNYAGESGSAINNNRGGAVTVTNSTVSANSAAAVGLDETLRGAGAIANNAELDARGTITVTASRILDNRAGGGRNGAGISNDGGGMLTVDRSTFSKNGASSDGGGIFNGTGEVTVTDSTFSENEAKDGGALASTGGSVTVLESTFSKNSAEGLGGAVLNGNQGAVTIRNTTFSDNAAVTGGGFSNEGAGLVTVEDSTFTKNVAIITASLASGEGGGMHSNSGGEVVLTGGSFTENKARGGGGFSNEGGGQVRITGTRFSANHAEAEGGGILVQSGAVRMLNIDVVGNVSSSALEGGGGISYHGDKAVAVGESAAVENSRIRNNKSNGDGGGIDSRGDGPLLITTTEITGNTAPVGGAIHHVGDAPLEVTRSTLFGNSADHGGGVLTDGDGETTLVNTTVSGNRASQFGGGVLISSRLTIRNSTVTNNAAASGGGVNNGGGDLVGDGLVFLANTIVAANPAGGNCAGIVTSRGGNVENANTCHLDELSDQPGTDPRLGPLADNGGPTQTHALLAGSPAQEKAVCTDVDPCPPVDQRGLDRPQFNAFDAGAYEAELTPSGGGPQQCAGLTERPVQADFDTWVSQGAPNSNFASDSILKVRSQAGANERALVHFTLPPVPPGCKLVGATLRLYSSAATDGRTLEALRVLSSWADVGITWANQPGTATPAASSQSGLGWLEWDVLAQARDMYALGDHGFLIRDRTESANGAQSFHSREKGADRPPELVLVFDDPDAPPPPGACPTVPQVFSADRDSWVSESSASNNFGSDSTLKVKSQAGADARALLRFPLPILPSGCTTVASAVLRVEATSAKADRTLELLQIASAWTEAGVTWTNQPTVTGPAATTLSAQGQLEWTVTEQLLGIYTSANHGFLIRDAHENGVGDEQTLNSRDKTTDGPPELMLVFDDSTPETAIDSKPPSFSRETEARFTFSSDRSDATFECSLDGAAFQACGSPRSVDGLTEGLHTFAVRATRKVRAVDPTPASYSWTVDATAPDSVLRLSPADPTNLDAATLVFDGSDNVDAPSQLQFQCRLDHPTSDWADCSSPRSYERLGEGRHTFEVRAVDRAGNVGAPASHAWTIDQKAPDTAIGDRPADPSGESAAGFGFGGGDNLDEPSQLRFECRLDHPGSDWADCSSPRSYGVGEGPHAFEVRAIDRAGNVDASPDAYSWTVDLTAPETTIGERPADPTKEASATFTFTAADNVDERSQLRIQCRLDHPASDWADCASPRSYEVLAEGRHTFEARAIDRAGNVGTPASHAWTIDQTAAATTIGDRPADATNAAVVSVSFSANETATFECALDGSLFAPCESPKEYADLPEGSHAFEVRATDRAGNTGAPATYSWTVDRTAPVTTIGDRPADPTNAASVSISFSANETATFACALNGSVFAPCESPTEYADIPEGSYTFEVRATDRAGNTGAAAASSWTVDRTPPDTTIGDHPDDPTNSRRARFGFAADERARFECALDGSSFAACESPAVYADLAEGVHTFQVQATDLAGNREETAASYSWTIDTTAPETTIDERPPDPSNSSSAALWFSADEAGASFECALDDAAFAPCVSPTVHSDLAEGRHTFQVRATDRAGNGDATAASYTWTVDTTAPETALGERPADPTNSNSARFTFTSDEASASFECARDETGFQPCDSPALYEDLAEGRHSFEVRAKDRAGNSDRTPAAYAWTVDLTAPETTIDARPADPTNSTAATFTFLADEAASFECARDGAAFAPCESPVEYAGLTEGRHTFAVRATDRAGNREPGHAAYAWTVDLTAPAASIHAGPDAVTQRTSAEFRFSADELGASLACSLDGSALTGCASPHEYTGLGEGGHSFRVVATDRAGNAGPAASYTWTIDRTAPETTISAGPGDPTNATSARFVFSAGENATFECSRDGSTFAACESPAVYAGLAEGPHTFSVRATDRAGNLEETAAGYSWTIDTTAPETTLGERPADPATSKDARFSFSADEQASFQCSPDGAAFAPCDSPAVYSNLAEGAHSFEVQAVDRAGNVDASPASHRWTVDTRAPETSIESGPDVATPSTSAEFSFSTDEPGALLACSLDGGPFSECASPREYTGLAEGGHTFRVQATDRAGNVDQTPASYSWTVDTTAPETSISDRPADPTSSGSASLSFSASEPATFTCAVDGGAFAACDSPALYANLREGRHSFQVQAVDPAGNADLTPATYSWTVDQTAPETTIDSAPPAETASTTASFAFSAEPGAAFECALDTGAFSSCQSPKEYTGLALGAHEFRVRATDRAGNRAESAAVHRWTVTPPPDTVAPETTIDSRPADPTNSTSASFAFSSSEPASFACSLDDAPFTPCGSPKEYAGLAAGTHSFQVQATDGAGNVGSPARYSWTIDRTPPETAIGERPADPTNSSSSRFTFSADEAASFECALGDAAFAACDSPLAYAELAEGSYTFQVRATDRAGNVDLSPASHRWTVDRTAPETTIASAPPPETTETTARFEFSAEPGATFECALDGGAFAACTSPRQYTGLSPGAHEFRVRATDRAGNTDPTPATHRWTIATPVDCSTAVTASANADAWIDQNSPASNKGGDSILKVQSKGPRDNFRALVRFPLPASVPQGCVIGSATLRLYAASWRTGRTLHALRVASSWSESQVTWGTQPQTTGSAASTASGQGYREWNVTSHVQTIYETGANHGFLIRDAFEDADAEQQFHSREKGETTPQLVIRFTSAPTTLTSARTATRSTRLRPRLANRRLGRFRGGRTIRSR